MNQPVDSAGLAERLDTVRTRIRRAAEDAGREPSTVRLLAVTKGHPTAAVIAALAAGVRDIGESRVQEAEAKRAEVAGGDERWHMVGHLQRNKARAAVALFEVVQSVDSVPLARLLDRHLLAGAPPLRVYVEVELTGLPGRTGVTEADATALVAAVATLPSLELVGLMTVAPPGPPEGAAACFARLRGLRDRLRDDHGLALPQLSMGMSDDFEVAIAEGSTIVRLGRVLFGDRPGRGRTTPAQLS